MQTKLGDFERIQQQFEEHLCAINETTSEIQAIFDYLHELDIKLDKLSQRVERLQLDHSGQEMPAVLSLTEMEKKIFLALYTESTPLSYKEIAVKANLPESLVPEVLSSLVEKGICFQRTFYHDALFLQLEPRLKELQARKNIINLSLQNFME